MATKCQMAALTRDQGRELVRRRAPGVSAVAGPDLVTGGPGPHRDRLRIAFNFCAAKQYPGRAACQTCTAACHHFHVNTLLAALTRFRMELCHAVARALEHFSMGSAKLRAFLQPLVARRCATDGLGCSPQMQALFALGQSSRPTESAANPPVIRRLRARIRYQRS